MATTFLRSGPLAPLQALGEKGRPVWHYALQIREALRLRHAEALANVLAIPQSHDAGDRLDWYAPVAGSAISWQAASAAERQQMLRQLEAFQEGVAQIISRARQADNPTLCLFAALLQKARHFPDPQHVWLVNGQAVITCWGFLRQQAKPHGDPLACLRLAPPAACSHSAGAIPLSVLDEPLPPPASAATAFPAARRRRAAILAGVAAAALLSGSAGWWLTRPAPAPVPPAFAIAPFSLPPLTLILPLGTATVVAPAAAIQPAPPRTLPAHALLMPEASVRAGSVSFLNGQWRVRVEMTPTQIGRQPVLRYAFTRGTGTARITLADGVSCRGAVQSGLMPSGALAINTRAPARCSDGSRYRLPTISCKAGAGDVADCSGDFGQQTVLPLTITRETR
ncbi:SrfA family protein [Pantoea sp. 1.19]|uniref:SrfA family protein n=1 Tax=Pantoea sp. 1.19 TaxID=1925589 RepID=UPI0009490934|nr:SrfA family protein [Pantoea sp. 1.19]